MTPSPDFEAWAEEARAKLSRQEAMRLGISRYFTGEPCVRGHICERNVSSKKCLQCMAEKAAKKRARDPEKAKESNKRNYEKHKEQRLIYMREYRKNNVDRLRVKRAEKYKDMGDKIREKNREIWAKNKDVYKEKGQEWRKSNKDKIKSNTARRRARIRGAEGSHTAKDIRLLMVTQGAKCACCSARLKKIEWHVDHIIPLARGGGNSKSNLQILCSNCNRSKNARDPIEFMQSRGWLL